MFVSFAVILYIFYISVNVVNSQTHIINMKWREIIAEQLNNFFMAAYCPKRLYLNQCSMKTLFSCICFADTIDFSPV